MNESAKYEMYMKKLEGICNENDLIAHIYPDNYPIRMVIQPLTDIDSQMSMLENVEENGYTSPDASITYYMKDGDLFEKIKGTFEIGDALKTKLKNLFKNLHRCYLQFFHREIIVNHLLAPGLIPNIKSDKDKLPEGAEPLETFEDEDDVPLPDDDDAEDDAEPDEDDPNEIGADDAGALGDLYDQAVKVVRAENEATTTLLMARLNCTYEEAVMLMGEMAADYVITPPVEYADGLAAEVAAYDEPDDTANGDDYE